MDQSSCPESPDSSQVTRILRELESGDDAAADRLLPLVYEHLRTTARARMRNERVGHTLDPTALVHEAFLKLVRQPDPVYANEAHFCAVAAIAMRRILIDHAHRHASKKRGGAARRIELRDEQTPIITDESSHDLLDLDAALKRLAERDDRMSRVVELRFFGGLTMEQIARVLEVSISTVESDWRAAQAWLSKEMEG